MSTTEKQIKELEYEYKTIKSDVIFRSKASELIKAVEPLGLKELIEPPVVLGKEVKNK
ncbi:MAG: FtsL-like putative cell division protein [Ferruginibacter sp.]